MAKRSFIARHGGGSLYRGVKNVSSLTPVGYAVNKLTGGSGVTDYVDRKAGKLWDEASGKNAADKAAAEQTKSVNEATASQERMFDKALATQEPWRAAGQRGLADLEAGIGSGRFDTKMGAYQEPSAFQANEYKDPGAFQFDDFQFDFEADPGYQFMLKEGKKTLEGSAAAKGGLFSGQTGRNLTDYTLGMASQEYGNAYNRARGEYQDDRNFGYGQFQDDRNFGYNRNLNDRNFGYNQFQDNRNFGYGKFMDNYNMDRAAKTDDYNRLASLSGVGQMTSGNIASQQMAQGGNLANLQLQQGNIDANRAMAGYQGGMNLVNTGLQGLGLAGGLMGGKR